MGEALFGAGFEVMRICWLWDWFDGDGEENDGVSGAGAGVGDSEAGFGLEGVAFKLASFASLRWRIFLSS